MMTKYFPALFLLLFSLASVFGQQPPPQQLPPVGTIDFYGLRTVSQKDVVSVLKIKTGDEWMKTLLSVEENRSLLKTLPGVEDASISLVCCDDSNGKSIVFVGIREKSVPALNFRLAPTGEIRLPDMIVQAGRDFQTAFAQAIAEKDFSEDESRGYALAGNKEVRKIQERFLRIAAENLKVLRRVLRESSVAEERALAAQIIAYAPDKQAVVGDLLYAARDSDEKVRNNSTRALILFAKYANSYPQSKIKIPADEFIPMLNSLDWTDRNKSLGVLDAITKNRDARLLARLKIEAYPSLVEMARWTIPGHAETAFRILGRLANFSDDEIQALWKSADREKSIQIFAQGLRK